MDNNSIDDAKRLYPAKDALQRLREIEDDIAILAAQPFPYPQPAPQVDEDSEVGTVEA